MAKPLPKLPRLPKITPSVLIPVTGLATTIKPAGKKFTLKELQQLVGGDIELLIRLPAPDGRSMFADEDGKRKNLPVNQEATAVFQHAAMSSQKIVGPVVLVAKSEIA